MKINKYVTWCDHNGEPLINDMSGPDDVLSFREAYEEVANGHCEPSCWPFDLKADNQCMWVGKSSLGDCTQRELERGEYSITTYHYANDNHPRYVKHWNKILRAGVI